MVKNHACLAIGINHYQQLEPLNYAQHDAEAFFNFLVNEVRIGSEQCILMTDSSPAVGESSSYPNRDNILQMLDIVCQTKLQKDDLLWFFFSGYGMSHHGQDYLMPTEADPADIHNTGIAIGELFAILKKAPCKMVVVLLDINRASTRSASEKTGIETLELAKRFEIPTILSSQVGQISREARTLRHGLFAACLLDALRYNRCINLETLCRYLSARLPELCTHHNLPVQEPAICIHPTVKAQWLIWQHYEPVRASVSQNGYRDTRQHNGNGASALSGGTPLTPLADSAERKASNGSNSQVKNTNTSPSPIPPPPPTPPTPATPTTPATPPTPPTRLTSPLLGCGAWLLVLLLGVFVGRMVFVSIPPTPEPASLSPSVSGSQVTSNSENASQTPARAGVAQTKEKQQTQPKPLSSQKLLDQAVLTVEQVSASRFSYAIAKARQIQPGDALYSEAQQNIDRWAGVILDIAKGRAKQGNFKGAIAAAKLVPKDRPALKDQAQALQLQWERQFQLQQANQQRLRVAQASIRRGSLESYARAIVSARQIKAGSPSYAEAQQLIAQWSQGIYEIALYRAARGRFRSAIEAASLVPPEAPAFKSAQKAMAQWRQRL